MKVNHLGGDGQDRMIRNGWTLIVRDSYTETPEQLFDRLSEKYSKVKVYWTGTRVRGIHSYFAMVKR